VALPTEPQHELLGRRLPPFALPDLRTEMLRTSREWAERKYILNFFASWWGPCNAEAPLLEELRRREADRSGLDVILIDVWEGDDARQRAQHYCELWGIEGTVLLDEAGAYAKLLGVRGVPTNVLVDSTGTIRAIGASNPDDLNAAVDELLRNSPRWRDPARVPFLASSVPSRA
jgi:thiol-disulfide isomerase/thioredoxin